MTDKKSESGEYWDKHVVSWEAATYYTDKNMPKPGLWDRFSIFFRGASLYERMTIAIEMLKPYLNGLTVLDVGCASGRFANMLLDAGAARGGDSILEFPFPALPTIRLNFGLPWIKLYGLGLSAALMRLFPPPSVIAFTTHAHDLYAPHLSDGVTALEKRALLRNSERGFDILETMIRRFQAAGYELAFMSEICDHVDPLPNLPSMPLDEWRYFLFKDFPWRQNSKKTSKNTPS